MKSAARISARGSKAYQWNVDARFLSAEAVAATEGWRAHPWLDPPAGSLPGKIAHVALITAAQSVVEGTDVEDGIPLCSPLISQPLVEACLRVPSWLWFEDGHNRFVARSAFRDQLPVDVLDRDSKGAPDCFVADLYDANRSKIRELLLGGLLRREKLLDDKAVDAALDNQAPVEGHGFLRLMRLVDAETWARSWS
jgi:asparagine synthase (glutamine-hydrolysing)